MATPNLSYQNFFTTTLSSSIVAGDTTIPLVSVPTPSEGYLVIEPDSSTAREIIYYTSKGASFVTCPSASAGRGVGGTTAASHASGATVQMNNNAEMWTAIQDGSANTGMHQWFNDSFADYVQTGGSVSSATGLIASISSGVTYINGRRLTFNAMSKTFTASKDTYVDLVAPSSADNIATVSYTEVASGVTSGISPVSNGIHIAKVNTGASTIGTISQTGYDFIGNPLKQSYMGSEARGLVPFGGFQAQNVSTLQTTASVSYTDLATVGPTVTLNIGPQGILLMGYSNNMYNSGANVTAVSFTLSGMNTRAASDSDILAGSGGTENPRDKGMTYVLTGLNPGQTTITIKYRVNAGTGSFERRRLWAMSF